MDNWLFVNNVPLLYPQKRLARQMQVEMWLDLDQVLKELGLKTLTVIAEPKPEQLTYIS